MAASAEGLGQGNVPHGSSVAAVLYGQPQEQKGISTSLSLTYQWYFSLHLAENHIYN